MNCPICKILGSQNKNSKSKLVDEITKILEQNDTYFTFENEYNDPGEANLDRPLKLKPNQSILRFITGSDDNYEVYTDDDATENMRNRKKAISMIKRLPKVIKVIYEPGDSLWVVIEKETLE